MEFAGKYKQDEQIFHRVFCRAFFSPVYSHIFYEIQHEAAWQGPIQEFIERPTTKDGWKWQIASVLSNHDWKMFGCLRYEKSRGRL